jgi:signal transduction histidine kinase
MGLDQLAHELNSLLDGSLRSVRLAQRALGERGSPQSHSDLARQLERATHAMRQMAVLLEQAMRLGRVQPQVFADATPLADALPRIMHGLASQAGERRIALHHSLDEGLHDQPIGLLSPIIINGLRNAMHACAAVAAPPQGHQVRLSLSITAAREVRLHMTDTGPGVGGGPMPRGHGIGLTVCRDLVAYAGGTLTLIDHAACPHSDGARPAVDHRGCTLLVTIPLAALGYCLAPPPAEGRRIP